jgi:hypothetical protein
MFQLANAMPSCQATTTPRRNQSVLAFLDVRGYSHGTRRETVCHITCPQIVVVASFHAHDHFGIVRNRLVIVEI